MPNKLYPTDVLKQAQDVLSAWNQVDAKLTIGTLTPDHGCHCGEHAGG